jgi:hypothetical protein
LALILLFPFSVCLYSICSFSSSCGAPLMTQLQPSHSLHLLTWFSSILSHVMAYEPASLLFRRCEFSPRKSYLVRVRDSYCWLPHFSDLKFRELSLDMITLAEFQLCESVSNSITCSMNTRQLFFLGRAGLIIQPCSYERCRYYYYYHLCSSSIFWTKLNYYYCWYYYYYKTILLSLPLFHHSYVKTLISIVIIIVIIFLSLLI